MISDEVLFPYMDYISNRYLKVLYYEKINRVRHKQSFNASLFLIQSSNFQNSKIGFLTKSVAAKAPEGAITIHDRSQDVTKILSQHFFKSRK